MLSGSHWVIQYDDAARSAHTHTHTHQTRQIKQTNKIEMIALYVWVCMGNYYKWIMKNKIKKSAGAATTHVPFTHEVSFYTKVRALSMFNTVRYPDASILCIISTAIKCIENALPICAFLLCQIVSHRIARRALPCNWTIRTFLFIFRFYNRP